MPLTYQTPPPPKIINPIIEIVPDQITIPDSDIFIDLGTEVTPDILFEGPPVVEPVDVLLDFSEVMPQPVF